MGQCLSAQRSNSPSPSKHDVSGKASSKDGTNVEATKMISASGAAAARDSDVNRSVREGLSSLYQVQGELGSGMGSVCPGVVGVFRVRSTVNMNEWLSPLHIFSLRVVQSPNVVFHRRQHLTYDHKSGTSLMNHNVLLSLGRRVFKFRENNPNPIHHASTNHPHHEALNSIAPTGHSYQSPILKRCPRSPNS